VWLLGACGGTVVSTGEPDGSPPEDDAGWDAGTPGRDAGPIADAGQRGDAGTHGDAGFDAGLREDGGLDAGAADWTGIGSVVDGGQLASLDFGDVGDTRPSFYDLPYPTQTITTIFQDMAGLSPPIAFVVSTGDYMFADPVFNDSATQAQLYVTASQSFPRQLFPAMGNHECMLAISSGNCFGTTDQNYEAYLDDILAGVGLPNATPYFVATYASADPTRPWTAKFVYTAPNAWDSGQDSWFAQVMAQPTTYTFVIRHEPTSNDGSAPGVAPTEQVLATAAYTLKLTGHSHEYAYDQTNREIINGVAGAPLDCGCGYTGTWGYVICRQRADMAIQCTLYDYDSNAESSVADAAVAVEPDGTPTAPD